MYRLSGRRTETYVGRVGRPTQRDYRLNLLYQLPVQHLRSSEYLNVLLLKKTIVLTIFYYLKDNFNVLDALKSCYLWTKRVYKIFASNVRNKYASTNGSARCVVIPKNSTRPTNHLQPPANLVKDFGTSKRLSLIHI